MKLPFKVLRLSIQSALRVMQCWPHVQWLIRFFGLQVANVTQNLIVTFHTKITFS